jgi:anti-anti-sigma factor
MHYKLVCNNEDKCLIQFSGHIKFKDHNIFKSLIDDEIANCTTPIICFDLQDLEFIDSSGISMLIMAKQHINNNGQKLEIINVNGQVQRIFEMTKMNEYLGKDE